MRRIIILETEPQADGHLSIRYALWANVPAARQPFWMARQGATFTSAVADGSLSPTEIASLQNGSVVERVVESGFQAGTTFAQAQPILQAALTAWQNTVTAYDPWAHYGTFFDDSTSTWTTKAVA